MKADKRQELLSQVRQRYQTVCSYLSEDSKRVWAASESITIGRGGDTIVSEATGISRVTISRGKAEVRGGDRSGDGRIRKSGGGRKSLKEKNPLIIKDLDRMIAPLTRGDPENPLRWTCKSTSKLAEALKEKGHSISQKSVYTLLQEMGYSMQSNKKVLEGKQHPDRDSQFQFINQKVLSFQGAGLPVISVDAKKKENIGVFKNTGAEWEKCGQPVKVKTYDFPDKEKGKACPYGVYDMTSNEGWVNVGISRDTAEFAVESIRRWWKGMGKRRYPEATDLLITADGGGSNGYRIRLWKHEIQNLSNELNVAIHVCHFPPGTSKWNKIEHQLFSFISKNWRGKPLDSIGTIVNLIASTTTGKGLQVRAEVDRSEYKKGIKISDEEMATLNIEREDFHGEWNYKIAPQQDEFRL
ncbi:MAG: ISAzo13 family transposase [Candidatus Electrothrix sp. ATG2]|nr:ISAzo13 family transposase [Candidatus Electrothrix sp. ATG2]